MKVEFIGVSKHFQDNYGKENHKMLLNQALTELVIPAVDENENNLTHLYLQTDRSIN